MYFYSGAPMPTIHVTLFEGRTVEQKRAAAKALTEAAVATLGANAESTDVIFEDVKKQDWATGGVLWSDPRPAK
jgi:4-oxalocrotonate tautomerase